MPSIDHSGNYRVLAKDGGGAIRFPVKASSKQAAKNFANRKVLELLPGWDTGVVYLRTRRGKLVAGWRLNRIAGDASGESR